MLKEHSNRICVFFALDFEAQLGYARRLSEAAEAVQGRFSAKHWSCSTERYFLRDTSNRFFLSLEYARFGYTGLGLNAWVDGIGSFADYFRVGLEKMGVQKLRRIGFKAQAFIPVEMSHHEICELMFGSFLVEAKDLEPICGKPDDLLIQLHGTHRGLKTQTVIAPVNAEQAVQSFTATPNLEFLAESKLYDNGIKEFRDRIAHDCLIVDSDISRNDLTPREIQGFARDALDAAEYISEAVVFRLKRMRRRKGERNGDSE